MSGVFSSHMITPEDNITNIFAAFQHKLDQMITYAIT
jgi:hypothetical protein